MCWFVDLETMEGICMAFCGGSNTNPTCDAGYHCTISDSRPEILCLPTCHPLDPACPVEGSSCVPWLGSAFVCTQDASGDLGAYGEPCDTVDGCDPGLVCAAPDVVPGCAASGCCTEFCDLTDPQGAAGCGGAAEGQQCLPWFPEGTAPSGHDNVGICATP
jgi:hypothetical protein